MRELQRLVFTIISLRDSIRMKIKMVDGDGGPGPVEARRVADGYFELLIAQATKDISAKITNRELRKEVFNASVRGFEFSIASMQGSFTGDDGGGDLGDDTGYFLYLYNLLHKHHWGEREILVTSVVDVMAAEADTFMALVFDKYGNNIDVVYAECLRILAGLTTDSTVHEHLINMAKLTMAHSGATGIARAIFEDECGSTGKRGPHHVIVKTVDIMAQ